LSGEMGTRRSREDSEIVEVMSHGERERESLRTRLGFVLYKLQACLAGGFRQDSYFRIVVGFKHPLLERVSHVAIKRKIEQHKE